MTRETARSKERSPADVSLVTGFPSFTARRLISKLIDEDAREQVRVLAPAKAHGEVDSFLTSLTPAKRRRIQPLEGDVADMDLGLGGAEYKALTAELTAIHHTQAIYLHPGHPGAARDLLERVNVGGTKAIVELAGECKSLRRLIHWSSAQVSGGRTGVILEEELDVGQKFRNGYEETKFRAEKLVAAAKSRMPITVLRPGLIVGDSKTGEIDRFDGPYYLVVLIVSSPLDLHLPLPGRGVGPLNLVPIDFIVDAAYALSKDPRAEGGTFHLTDPCPFAARTVYEQVAKYAQRKAPRGMFPSGLARALLRAPGLERFSRAPREFLETFNHLAMYNCRGTLQLLGDLRCPAFDQYVAELVRYVREVQAKKRERPEEESHDPLD